MNSIGSAGPNKALRAQPLEPARPLSFGRRLPHFQDRTHSAIRHWGAGPTRPQRGHGPSRACPGQGGAPDEHVVTHPFGRRGPSTMFPVMNPAFHCFLYSHRCLLGLLTPPPSLIPVMYPAFHCFSYSGRCHLGRLTPPPSLFPVMYP